MKKYKRLNKALGCIAIAASGVIGSNSAVAAEEAAKENLAAAGDFSFQLSGYARAWASFNLDNQPELSVKKTAAGVPVKGIGKSSGKLSMLRGSILLDGDASFGTLKMKAIARLDREYKTNYLQSLENLRKTNGTSGGKSIRTTIIISTSGRCGSKRRSATERQ